MELWQRSLISAIPLLIVAIVFALFEILSSRKQNGNSESKTVLRIPKYFRTIMLICSLFWFPIETFCLLQDIEDWPFVILFLCAFQLPGFLAFYFWTMWKVEILKDGFVYRNYFGKKVRYYFSELVLWEHPKGMKWYFLKNGKKILCLAYYVEGQNILYKNYHKYITKQKGKESD